MDRLAKRKQTQQRRQSMTCKVYQVKIDKSHLSISTEEHLSRLFLEAKWFYNYCLSQEDVNNADTTAKSVPVKVGDVFENRCLTILPGQVKQAIKSRLFDSLKTLHRLKQKGSKVGRLKFKSVLNSIPLRQYNATYFIGKNKIKIAGLKSWLRVRGLGQISKEAEIANAVLLRKGSNYYLNITTYTNTKKQPPEASIGIDFGCQTQLSFSNDIKVEFQVPISKRLKRLDRKISKKHRKDSKNKEKDKAKRRKEYEYITNQKTDIRHKVVSTITNNFKYVCFQDESIHAWAMSRHGKKIQNTAIGDIISDLKHKSVTPLEVNKFFPSTQLCPKCGTKNKLSLGDRIYSCNCGYVEDRDIKSAICIEVEGLKQVPTDRREFKPGEILASTFFDILSKINGIRVSKLGSLSQEAVD